MLEELRNICFMNLLVFFIVHLPLDWIGGYGGGGLIQVPSGLRMCRRSLENSARYCSAGITLKNLDIFNHRFKIMKKDMIN